MTATVSNPSGASKQQYVERLLNLGVSASENDVTVGILDFLRDIHPGVGHRTESPAGGRKKVDLVIEGVAVEVKARGKINETKDREQIGGYLEGLCAEPRPDLGVEDGHNWKGILSDGCDWYFCDFEPGDSAECVAHIRLGDDTDGVEQMLGRFIDASILPAPPTDRLGWIESLLTPFSELAKKVKSEPYFEVKQQLWKDILAGAQVVPLDGSTAAMELFVRHTFLVVTARLVAETISDFQTEPAEGFANWVVQGQSNTS